MSKSLVEKFEDIDLTVIIDENGELWFNIIDISKSLGYVKPKQSADWILENNAEYFRDKITLFPTPNRREEENRFLPEVEANFFVICSQKPKAKALQYRLAEIAKSHRVMISSYSDPLKRGLEISKQLVKVFETQIEQQKQLDVVHEKVLHLEERQEELAEELINLTKRQRYNIQNKIKDAVINCKDLFPTRSEKQLFQSYYGVLKDYFKVPSYGDINREKFPEAMKLLNCMETLVLSKKLDLKEYITSKQVVTLCRRNALF